MCSGARATTANSDSSSSGQEAGLPKPSPAAEISAETETSALALPLSKLRGLTIPARAALRLRRITTCGQLLRAAGRTEDRARLARETGIDPDDLLVLVQRADMARVNGVGSVFGLMLEDLGVADVSALAAQNPAVLHARLRDYNQAERLARRSPTPEEVAEWVTQARVLSPLITY